MDFSIRFGNNFIENPRFIQETDFVGSPHDGIAAAMPEEPSYRLRVHSRPGNPTPIYVTIANVSHLTLTQESLGDIFALANRYTLNTPYPLGDWPMRHAGQVAYRPNHNGTHSARQAAYLGALFDLVSSRGSRAAKTALDSLSEDEINNLYLGAYFLRAGRVDESTHLDPPIDDYNTRSALIYEQYAEQLGVSPSIIAWVKMLIVNSCKQAGMRDVEIDANPKNKFGFEALSFVHDLDLIRCFEGEKMAYVINKMQRRLNYFIADFFYVKDRYLCRLLDYARALCDVTGCRRVFDQTPGNRSRFMACSVDGKYCWQMVRSVSNPIWSM